MQLLINMAGKNMERNNSALSEGSATAVVWKTRESSHLPSSLTQPSFELRTS
jgi:hypothetical protein